jgi:tetratricopeptide (TPR) repeat protein
LEKTLEAGLKKFPEEKYFLMSLINIYIYSNRNEQAIQYLSTAIQQEPNNPQLYTVMGRVYESGVKDIQKAEEYLEKALAIDPEDKDALSSIGRVYYNQGVNKLGEANMINDSKLYQEESERAKDFFRKALPYFEKVQQKDPEDRESMIALRAIYYNLNMNAEFDAIESKMN